ncbi:hypothetical protein [Caenispirillum bisanense]|uniref:Uncharacterized protein n=1 Tax=Caenispirillum bisanense TaxID=414052 RepID=A0A286G6T9_9PROT|nr:hypothetical protein [Caenispirillum bisanense]SOD91223.1 hypothetical protein SAMN05421508_101864 [Caenispirillum bisanense]
MTPGEVAGRRVVRGRLLWRMLLRDGGVTVHTFDEPTEPGGRPVPVARTVLHIDGDITLFTTPTLARRPDLAARHQARVEAQAAVLRDFAADMADVPRHMRVAAVMVGSLASPSVAALDTVAFSSAISAVEIHLLGGVLTAGLAALAPRLLRSAAPRIAKLLFGA